MKVVVLAGGLSPERNVSLSSGVMVTKALRSNGHEVALVDLFFGLEDWVGAVDSLYNADIPASWQVVAPQAPDLDTLKLQRKDNTLGQFGKGVLELCQGADMVFLALHGSCGEDGRIQATLNVLGIPFTGSDYLGSAMAMDKDLTKKMVAPHGIFTPAWEVVEYGSEQVSHLAETLICPCVVKPMDSGSSIGVSIAHTREELKIALEVGLDFGGKVIVEQYISGREIQVGVLEGKALPSIEIVIKDGFYDYENKYQAGAAEEICPSQITAEQEKVLGDAAVKIHGIMGLSVYSRTDFILDPEGQWWFLEINTLPGMTPTSLLPQEAAAVGIDYPELCQRILMESLNVRRTNCDTWEG